MFPSIPPRSRRRAVVMLASLGLGTLGWAALAPVEAGSREEMFEIPPGTADRRLGGDEHEILPQTIRLRLGINDVLVLKNSDTAPHLLGPTLVMPGQTFRLPFTRAATYSFLCTAHADGQLDIVVEPGPEAGWERLRWRWHALTGAS